MSKKRIFAEEHPEYLKYWDFEKNTLDPYKIGPMCNEKAYWKCEHGHRFERIVFNMSRGNTTCPECKKRSTMVISKPEIMKFWDKEKNTLDPEITPARSNEYAWFKCPKCGYSWRTQICGRLRTDKCPACETNNVIRKGVNDFRTVSPQLALDTSDELNPDIDLNKLGIGSKTRIHWKCHICGFEWDAPIHGRAHRYNGNNGIAACPACAKVRRKDGYDVDYPELVPLYSPNNPIPLNEVRGVKAKFLWICPKHGEYEQKLGHMIRALKNGTIGCPYCNGFKVRREDSAGAKAPELIKEWASSNESTLYEYAPNSKYLATWCCPDCGTKWKAPINVRVQGYGKCPTCYGNKTFKERYPELEKFYAKDNTLPYEDAIVSDYTPRNWICEKGHEFTASFYKIHDQGFRCPYCENKKALKGYNDFEHLYPVLAQDYDEEKNGNKASEVVVSYRNVYFKCKNGHSFVRPIIRHVELNGQCPICSGTVLKKGSNDLATIYPAVILFWDYEKNEKRPDQVLATLDNSYHFVCSNGHHFKCTLRELVENDFHCPVCEGKRVDPEKTSLQALNPELASEFSVNNKSTASQIAFDTSKKVLWTCPTCGEDYLYPVNERKIGDNSCPYCNHTKLKSGVNDLTITNPQLASEFSPRNDKKANEVGEWQKYEVFWICPTCGREYTRCIRDKTPDDSDCPYCHGTKVLTGYNDLATTDPDLAVLYSSKNDRPVSMVRKDSNSYVYWECPECHYVYAKRLNDKAPDNSDCPICSKRLAIEGLNSLQDEYPDLPFIWSDKNEKKTTEVTSLSSYKAIWVCPTCKHEFKAEVRRVVAGEIECPVCTGKVAIAGYNSFADEHPDIPFIWSEKNDKKPTEVTSISFYDAIWYCPTCKQEFRREVRKMTVGVDECPICTGRVAIEGYNSLADEHPEIVSLWSINNDKKPTEVTSTSSYSALWCCPTCGEEYRGQVRDMVSGAVDCPICSGKKARAGLNSLLDVYPEIQNEWAENENALLGIFPDEILPTSNARVWWECKDCGRKYLLSVNMWVEKHIRGMTSCTYCSGLRMRETHILL